MPTSAPAASRRTCPRAASTKLRDLLRYLRKLLVGFHDLLEGNGIFMARCVDVGYLDLAGCIALGVTGPILRSAGLPWDLRKSQPYFGYEKFDFDVPTVDTCDVYGRFLVRLQEMYESVKIIDQALDLLEPGPVMVEDKKIALAGAAGHRQRRAGQLPRPHPPHHGRVDGGADPPLQARDRGFPGSRGPGLRGDRAPDGRAGVHHRERRRHASVPCAHARPLASPTCSPSQRCASAGRSPTSSPRSPRSTR